MPVYVGINVIAFFLMIPLGVGDFGDVGGGQGVVHQVAGVRVLPGLPRRLLLQQGYQLNANLATNDSDQ